MARRRRRLVLGVLGGVVGLAVLAVVLLPALVPSERLLRTAEQQVRERTGGEVSLGSLSVRVLPRLRLVLGASTLSVTGDGLRGAGQEPGPLVGADAAIERLEVDLALWPLLRRRMEFGQVSLVRPRLDLVTRPAGDGAAGVGSGTADAAPAPAFGLALATVAVRDGEVRWREDGTGRAVAITGWRQDLEAPAMGVLMARLARLGAAGTPDGETGTVGLALETHLDAVDLEGFGETPIPRLEDVRLTARLDVPAAADRVELTVAELSMPDWRIEAHAIGSPAMVEIDRLTVTGGESVSLEGTGRLVPPPARGRQQLALRGSVDLETLPAILRPWMPEPVAETFPDLTGALRMTATADLAGGPALDDVEAWRAAWDRGLDGTLQLGVVGAEVTVATPELGEPLRMTDLQLTADLRSPRGRTRLDATADHPALRGDVSAEVVPSGDDGAVQVRLELPRLDLDVLAAAAEEARRNEDQARAGFSLVRSALAAPAAPEPAVGELIPPELAADFDATAAQLVFLKSVYTDVRLVGTLRERVIDVPTLGGRLGTGAVSGRASLDYAADPRGRAAWDARLDDVPADLLLAPYAPYLATIWHGTLNATTKGSCDLADPGAILRSLTITGDLTGNDGTVDLRQSLGGAARYLGDRQDLLRVAYSTARQHFEVREGKIMVEGIRIDGPETDWRGDGWFALDGTMSLDLSVRLPAGFTPDLGDVTFLADALRDDEGRIGLDFTLSGETRNPAVKLNLDPAELLKSDAVQEEIQDEVKKGLGGLLDRLKGK